MANKKKKLDGPKVHKKWYIAQKSGLCPFLGENLTEGKRYFFPPEQAEKVPNLLKEAVQEAEPAADKAEGGEA